MLDKYSLNAPKMTGKRPYHRAGKLSVPEIMTIMILFHNSGYRCLKHFYLNEVCVNLRHLFPQVVSYNRFVELEKEAVIPLTIFIKKVLLEKCTGISFVDGNAQQAFYSNNSNLVYKPLLEILSIPFCSSLRLVLKFDTYSEAACWCRL